MLVKNRLHLRKGLPLMGSDGSTVVSVLSCPSACSMGHSTGWTAGEHRPRNLSPPPPSPGTSNWSEDYFSGTAGVGLVVSQKTPSAQPAVTTVQEQLRQLFERDWSSHYAMGLDRQIPSQDCVW